MSTTPTPLALLSVAAAGLLAGLAVLLALALWLVSWRKEYRQRQQRLERLLQGCPRLTQMQVDRPGGKQIFLQQQAQL